MLSVIGKSLRLSILSVLLLTACIHKKQVIAVRDARVSRHSIHIVQKGETLYSIAWQHSDDYRQLAKYNYLKPPYALKIGQRLRLHPRKKYKTHKHVVKRKTKVRQAYRPRRPLVKKPRPMRTIALNENWCWPTRGRVINRFALASNKGINIAGKRGQVIRAAKSGRVAYAGQGIRGYGKLLILKHNDLYLSAYAHNQVILVREGAWVKKGQIIARMGHTGTRRVMLHFEIRRAGRPVNPMRYLPKHA